MNMPTTSQELADSPFIQSTGTDAYPATAITGKDKTEDRDSNIVRVDFTKKRLKGTSSEVPDLPKKDTISDFLAPIVASTKYSSAVHEKQSRAFLQSMRPFLITDILNALHEVQPFAGTAKAAMYIYQIFETKTKMESLIYDDSILEIIRALYDSLACNDRWTDYNAKQYQKAFNIIEPLLKLYPVSQGEIDRAILALEEEGFDTTPYALAEEESST